MLPWRVSKGSADDIAALLSFGTTPENEFVPAPLSEVMEGTAKLTDADRKAIGGVQLKSIQPLPGHGG